MKRLRELVIVAALLAPASAMASTVLYDQDFENPTGFVNNGADLSQQSVNSLYGNQPPGFVFAQDFTVETLRVGGNLAFGAGYVDNQNIAGNYMLGMLSGAQDDKLGLAFNVGAFDFLNLRLDITSVDLSCCGGQFVPNGDPSATPIFRFSLYDNPGGAPGVGAGAALDFFDVEGLANPSNNVLLFSEATGGLDATGSTNGNVILRIDLLQGGYAGFDNLRVVASNIEGDVGGVPEPSTWALMIGGFGLAGGALRRRRAVAA